MLEKAGVVGACADFEILSGAKNEIMGLRVGFWKCPESARAGKDEKGVKNNPEATTISLFLIFQK